MKRVLPGIFISIILILILATGAYAEEHYATEGLYPQTYIVTEVSEETDNGFYLVTVESCTGFLYQFYSEDEDWLPGDLVACIMSDNGTENITDDEILSTRYAGIAEWFMEIYPNK